ncbi:hypothetical protein TNCT_515931 [Trichonephila clavata]|uniref:Uncharacterized protein n=1 Tax=Trichonephila clavata TaxID=2740835 RepID=A0A8X6KGC5_TRICU|nr:hypothetical protein TNCT_515931 [Trichonephila clavata]
MNLGVPFIDYNILSRIIRIPLLQLPILSLHRNARFTWLFLLKLLIERYDQSRRQMTPVQLLHSTHAPPFPLETVWDDVQ